MLKMIVEVYRKPGLSIEEFENYWLNVHGPLVKRYSHILRFKRYIQSHNIHSEEVREFTRMRGWPDPCEALAEVWWESEEDMREALSSAEGQAAQKALAEDEAKFCDMTRMGAFLANEKTIFDYT